MSSSDVPIARCRCSVVTKATWRDSIGWWSPSVITGVQLLRVFLNRRTCDSPSLSGWAAELLGCVKTAPCSVFMRFAFAK